MEVFRQLEVLHKCLEVDYSSLWACSSVVHQWLPGWDQAANFSDILWRRGDQAGSLL